MIENRIIWLDAVKGVGIVSVIIAHVYGFVYQLDGGYIALFIMSYYMPIFFLASGFARYKFLLGEKKESIFAYKNFVLLIPFFVLGVTYNVFRLEKLDIQVLYDLIFSNRCSGYWFIFVLCLMNLFIILTRQIYISKNLWINCLMPFVIGGIISLFLIYMGIDSLKQFYLYYPYFVLGAFLRRYDINTISIKNIIFISILACVVFVLYVIKIGVYTKLLWLVQIPMSLMVFILISKVNWSASFVGLILLKLGNISLYIYCIHYFIIQIILKFNILTLLNLYSSNVFIQNIYAFVVAFFILSLTYLICYFIKSSNFFNLICFGVK